MAERQQTLLQIKREEYETQSSRQGIVESKGDDLEASRDTSTPVSFVDWGSDG